MEYEKRPKIYKIIMLIIVTITITIIGTTIVLYKYWGENKDKKYVILPSTDDGISADISRLKNIVEKYYNGEINDEKLREGALKGLISGLEDEYSEYISKEEMDSFEATTMGNYEGIGIYFGRYADTNEVVIISTIKNSPAYEAGILSGDIIVKIDEKEILDDDSLTDISSRIKGKEETKVKLTIKRDNELKEFEVERKTIKLHYIESEILENNIGYLSVSSFDEGTCNEFIENYEELNNKGIKSLIIDLRNNGGGIVQEATGIADYILKKDSKILITKDKNGEEKITIAENEHSIDLPIVVLVNNYSASASEILAGALKDNNVAKIVGEKTYGKGVIQNVFTLSNGAGLKLTTSEYFTPNNNKINKIGIEPDAQVELPEETKDSFEIENKDDTQLQKAIEILK